METIIAAIIFIGISTLLMSVSILFKKNGKFPDTEIESNKEMLKRGIKCAKQDELKVWGHNKGANSAGCSSASCGIGGCNACEL